MGFPLSLRFLYSVKFEIMGAFFWDYSGYSYSGLGITEYTEFNFEKNANSGNGIPMAEVT